MHTYVSLPMFPTYARSSLQDEDWIEREPKTSGTDITSASAAQRIREWRPQTTVNAMATTNIGFSDSSTLTNTSIIGFGGVKQLIQPSSMTTMGFMTSREALSILPPEQLTNADSSSRKRKADSKAPTTTKSKSSKPKQTTLQTWINQDSQSQPAEPAIPPSKVYSSGIIHDRGKATKSGPTLPQPHEMSSPSRGLEIEALPSLSFSSPAVPDISVSAVVQGKSCVDDDVPTSPLSPFTQPATSLGVFSPSPCTVVLRPGPNSILAERRSLGIRRGMKPWSSKK
jgi:hypothetical protein